MSNLNNLIFLDTETTGLTAEDRICQCAYIYQDAEYNQLCKPPVPISFDAMAVSHITNEMVEDKPSFVRSAMFEHLKEIISHGGIIVAHNATFDLGMLAKEGITVPSYIDTVKIASALDAQGTIPRYSLQYLRYYLGLQIEGEVIAHDALGDVRVLKALFKRQFAKCIEEGKSEEEVIAWMIKISTQPMEIRKFSFGKYNGESVAAVAAKDQGYLEWLLGQKEKAAREGEVDEDWIFTLRKYI